MNYVRTRLDFESSDALRASMNEHFPAAVEPVDDFGNPVFTIAPRVPEFGPLVADISPASGFTLRSGRFTHTHFDADVDEAPSPRELAETLSSLCKDVTADRVFACCSTPGGGFSLRGRPSWFERLLSDGTLGQLDAESPE